MNRLSVRSSRLVMLLVPLLVSLFAGCASVRPGTVPAAPTSAPKAKPVAAELMPGEQIVRGTSLLQSEPVREDASVPVSAALRRALNIVVAVSFA